MDVFVKIMDIYFIRRFLDKDYIQHGVVYTGISHSLTYIYILSNYFGFKITHYNYAASVKNLDELNKKIRTIKYPYDFQQLFYPKVLAQCVDLTTFPKNFE
jgi:hypothetical protein